MTKAMPLLSESASNPLSLEKALMRLAADERVDGLALFGSRPGGRAGPVSDYDLLVLVSSLPLDIFQMLSHIDGRMVDIVFVLTGRADRLLEAAGPVATNTQDGRFLLKMQTAQIVYDASGRLARAQALARQGGWRAAGTFGETYGAWFWHNHALFHIRRMAQSDDPAYRTAVDLMLCGALHDICRAYCLIRGVPWEGEKAAMRYLAEHDAPYLALLRECLAMADRAQKLELFEQLVTITLGPAGETWQPGCTAVALEGPYPTEAGVRAALDFWQSFFREQAA